MGSILETKLLTAGASTHVLQADTYYVRVVCISGGGGGSSGFTGGACGAVSDFSMPVSYFGGAGSTVNYTVGAGGAGGTGGGAGFRFRNPGYSVQSGKPRARRLNPRSSGTSTRARNRRSRSRQRGQGFRGPGSRL